MEGLVLYLVQLLQISLLLAAIFGIFTGIAVLRASVQHKIGQQTTFDFSQILNFVHTAVKAVAQIHSVRPEGLTDTEWNVLRYQTAETAVIDYAKSLGIVIDEHFLGTIRAAIEAAVLIRKKQDKPSYEL